MFSETQNFKLLNNIKNNILQMFYLIFWAHYQESI